MPDDFRDLTRAFRDAADWYVDMVGRVGDRWDEPGLGEWSIRDLVGHTSRAFLTVESYLAQPAARAEIPSAPAYYLATREIARGPEVAQRGRDAGAALGENPASAVSEIASRVVAHVDACDGSELVTTIVGGMRLDDYLRTRLVELAVHTADLAVAIGERPDVPAHVAAEALRVVTDVALEDGTAGLLLLHATGRRLPGGFSVL